MLGSFYLWWFCYLVLCCSYFASVSVSNSSERKLQDVVCETAAHTEPDCEYLYTQQFEQSDGSALSGYI